jgi:hypothetical protein
MTGSWMWTGTLKMTAARPIRRGMVTKPPKPGFGSFGAIDVGVVWGFLYTHRRLLPIRF